MAETTLESNSIFAVLESAFGGFDMTSFAKIIIRIDAARIAELQGFVAHPELWERSWNNLRRVLFEECDIHPDTMIEFRLKQTDEYIFANTGFLNVKADRY